MACNIWLLVPAGRCPCRKTPVYGDSDTIPNLGGGRQEGVKLPDLKILSGGSYTKGNAAYIRCKDINILIDKNISKYCRIEQGDGLWIYKSTAL